MGRFKTAIDAEAAAKSAEFKTQVDQLNGVRETVNRVSGLVINAAGGYKDLLNSVEDADDQLALDARYAEVLQKVKADFAAQDEQTQAIIKSFLTAINS